MDCCYSEKLINKLLKLNEKAYNKVDVIEVKRAIYFAKEYHGNQRRQSGEPYYSHPLEVAYMVADYLFRTDAIITAILHDTIEDTELTKEIISTTFGDQVATQVMDLTRIKSDRKISSAEMLELLYQQKKYDLLLIKLFDRLHNMQTIGAKSPEKIQKILIETIQEFFVLSIYLGLPEVRTYIVKLCIKYLGIRNPLQFSLFANFL